VRPVRAPRKMRRQQPLLASWPAVGRITGSLESLWIKARACGRPAARPPVLGTRGGAGAFVLKQSVYSRSQSRLRLTDYIGTQSHSLLFHLFFDLLLRARRSPTPKAAIGRSTPAGRTDPSLFVPAISADDHHSAVNPHETAQRLFVFALEYYFPIVAFTSPSHFFPSRIGATLCTLSGAWASHCARADCVRIATGRLASGSSFPTHIQFVIL